MSTEEITSLREDIAGLTATLTERHRAEERNSSLIKTVAGIVVIQLMATIFIAGQKIQKLDQLLKL